MLLSYNWLKDLLPDLKLSPEEVAQELTIHSFEVDVVSRIHIDNLIVTAEIESISPHPDADRLRLVTINNGQESIQVVCGGQNISVGDIVPFSPIGTKVKNDDGSETTLEKVKIRGVESVGMLNSQQELGLGDAHSGIYILPKDTVVGKRLNEYIINDTILDADITPNRAHDCLSHVGVARELAALLDIEIIEPETPVLPKKELTDWKLEISEQQHVSQYLGVRMNNVVVEKSPLWLQARLIAAGIRPVNNVVDITNFVTLEFGNPSHAFDVEKLSGNEIGVRFAQDNESIITLDGKEHKLSHNNLLITNQNKPVAIAGVMGGSSSEVDNDTSEILLEVASFKSYTIQVSASDIKIVSESSRRFSKGISSHTAVVCAQRATQLLQEITGADIVGVIGYCSDKKEKKTISFNPKRVTAITGIEVSDKTSKEVLKRLRCTIDTSEAIWQVVVPSDRLDLLAEHDLVEEVIRVIGLDNILASKLEQVKPQMLPKKVLLREYIKDKLVEFGATEVYNYSFELKPIAQAMNLIDKEKALQLSNPVSPEQAYLRVNLVPRLIDNLITNKAELRTKNSEFNGILFEIGKIFNKGNNGLVEGIVEEDYLAIISINPGEIIKILIALGADEKSASIKKIDLSKYKLSSNVEYITIGLKNIRKIMTIPENYQPKIDQEPIQYQVPNQYPAVKRDISLLVSPNIRIEQIQEIIESTGKELVVDVDLFDTYEDKNNKSLAFHITYQSSKKTLTNEEIARLHNEIISTLKQELGIELR